MLLHLMECSTVLYLWAYSFMSLQAHQNLRNKVLDQRKLINQILFGS